MVRQCQYMNMMFVVIVFIDIAYCMKEESQLDSHEQGAIINGDWSYLQAGSNSTPSVSVPHARFKHQSFYYKNRIYVHGGTNIPSTNMLDDPLDLFAYNLEEKQSKKWEWIKTKSNNIKEMEVLSGHAGVVCGNKWFTFGGSNVESRANNLLWRLNLDNYEWTKLQQKGEVPSARESAHLFSVQKNWLMLYGGISVLEIEIYNSIHFYNVETKNWSHCEGTYLHQAHARLDPAMVLHYEHLYLFGGTYRNSNNEEKYLNDFYDVGISSPGRNIAGKVQLRRLISTAMPQSRSGHMLVGVGENFLLLIGGQNSTLTMCDGIRSDDVSLIENAWVYNIKSNIWNKIEFRTPRFRFRTMGSCAVGEHDKLYIFGGIELYSQVLGDLIELRLNLKELAQDQHYKVKCLRCEQKQMFNTEPRYYSSDLIDDMVSNIQFPFAAIGLLVDNAVLSAAQLVTIDYFDRLDNTKIKLLRMEDNASFLWTEEEFVTSINNFDAGPTTFPPGIDKKTKSNLIRDNLRREFGYNLKLGSLRLGKSFLYISVSENKETIRVCHLRKQQNANHSAYILSYYCYSKISNKVRQPHMEALRRKIQKQYGQLIIYALNRDFMLNTLYIFDPCIVDYRFVDSRDESELKAHIVYNDIVNGSVKDLVALQKAGYSIMDCVDVSLRAYLTCLYLKNEGTKIYLDVKGFDPTLIHTQIYLQKVDRLCRSKHVLQINNMLQFELKIVELYYLYDLRKKLGYFSNGLMIYHKNRLITRYKYKLGELISRKMYKNESNYNFIRLFGFVELPDHIPINIFKTKCSYQIMMEKLYSRFKFINKILKKELKQMVIDSNLKRLAPLKLTDEEIQNDVVELQIEKEREALKQNSNVAEENHSKRELDKNNNSDQSNSVMVEGRHQLKQIYSGSNNDPIDDQSKNAAVVAKSPIHAIPRVSNYHLFQPKDQGEDKMQNQQDNDSSSSSSEEQNEIDEQKDEDRMPVVLIEQNSSNYQLVVVSNNDRELIQQEKQEIIQQHIDEQLNMVARNGQILRRDEKAVLESNKSDELMAKQPALQLSNHNEINNIQIKTDNSCLFQRAHHSEKMQKPSNLSYQQALQQK